MVRLQARRGSRVALLSHRRSSSRAVTRGRPMRGRALSQGCVWARSHIFTVFSDCRGHGVDQRVAALSPSHVCCRPLRRRPLHQALRVQAASSSEFERVDAKVRSSTMDAVDSLGAASSAPASGRPPSLHLSPLPRARPRLPNPAGRKCTVGDLASRAGLKTSEAELALQALAADTGATIQVSEEGQIAYVFPAGYRGALDRKSLALRVAPALEKVTDGRARIPVSARIAAGSCLSGDSLACTLCARTAPSMRLYLRGALESCRRKLDPSAAAYASPSLIRTGQERRLLPRPSVLRHDAPHQRRGGLLRHLRPAELQVGRQPPRVLRRGLPDGNVHEPARYVLVLGSVLLSGDWSPCPRAAAPHLPHGRLFVPSASLFGPAPAETASHRPALPQRTRTRMQEDPYYQMNFLESVFSFVFGAPPLSDPSLHPPPLPPSLPPFAISSARRPKPAQVSRSNRRVINMRL